MCGQLINSVKCWYLITFYSINIRNPFEINIEILEK